MTFLISPGICDGENKEQGSILFFVLSMIMVISGVVYYYFNPYRVAVDEFIASRIRSEGVMEAYSIERTLSVILPRMDMNIYKMLHNLPFWSPVSIHIPLKNNNVIVRVMSMNNCINISALNSSSPTTQNSRLNVVLDNLADQIIGKTNQHNKLASVLTAPKDIKNGLSESFYNQRGLSAEQRTLRARAAPFVCHRADTGQLININAISPQQFPVLLAVLPEGITEQHLQAAWLKKGRIPWKSTDDFIQAISPSTSFPSSVRDELLVSDEEIQVTLSYRNKRGDDFYMSDNFLMDGDSMILVSRHLFRDDDIR